MLAGDTAWLGLGATLPAFEGRGAQSALIARRVRDAARLGATYPPEQVHGGLCGRKIGPVGVDVAVAGDQRGVAGSTPRSAGSMFCGSSV